YAVPEALLRPHLPRGLELDLHDGKPHVSLVAFQFLDTRVLGVRWPGYRDFCELNLRCYVRCGTERGVVFLREFVPQRLTAWLARVIYNEPYRAAPLCGTLVEGVSTIAATYHLDRAGRHTLRVVGRKPAARPAEDSLEHFFKEHYWGFGVS